MDPPLTTNHEPPTTNPSATNHQAIRIQEVESRAFEDLDSAGLRSA
jgi:hypothetical protein